VRPVVVLRPEPGASATAAKAQSLGLEVRTVPLFTVAPVSWKAPDPEAFDGLVATSGNIFRCGGPALDALLDLPVHAVGEATAAAARDAGFRVATTGEHGIDALLSMIDPSLRLLHPCGEERREPVNPRQSIVPLVVYRAVAIADPPLGTLEGAVALVHSPRAGRRFAGLVSRRESTHIAAISDAAAVACGSGWCSVTTSDVPSDEGLLALAARLCHSRGEV
jgi:uroporphyrinogen-III synthase